MTACAAFERHILDRASGEIAPIDAARLERHLAACAACRAEAEAVGLALSLAALPPPSDVEREAVARGAGEALRRHRAGRRRLAGGLALAIAASAAFALAVPWYLLTRHAGTPAPALAAAPATTAWEVPDLDAAWEAAAVADPDAVAEGDAASEPEILFAELQEVDFDPE